MSLFLSFKEVWRNKGRFFLFSLVIALITTLVLFIAALTEGLALANKEYLENLDADLLVFQENAELLTTASFIDRSLVNDIQRVKGVAADGPIGFSNGTLIIPGESEPVDISLIGVEAGKPGMPKVISGETLMSDRSLEVVIDFNLANQYNLAVGDMLTIRIVDGDDEEFHQLPIVGITTGQQYLYAPSIFLPYRTWNEIRPSGRGGMGLVEQTANIVAVQIEPGYSAEIVKANLLSQVPGIEVTDIKTAYEALPGYAAQQSTLDTQRYFTLLIGILVIGGFFQIQLLQKIPQIGVLKAIGVSNTTVAIAVVLQIILVTTFGVLLGSAVSFGLSIGIPGNVPIVFNGSTVALSIVSLLLIGPLGGLVTVRKAISVEPLLALGLSS